MFVENNQPQILKPVGVTQNQLQIAETSSALGSFVFLSMYYYVCSSFSNNQLFNYAITS